MRAYSEHMRLNHSVALATEGLFAINIGTWHVLRSLKCQAPPRCSDFVKL